MKSCLVLICAAALSLANGVNGFFMPASGSLVGGASSASRASQMVSMSSIAPGWAHHAGCSCSSCTGAHGRSCSCVSCTGAHGRSCACPSCSSGVSRRSSVGMNAHRGCGDTTSHSSASCECDCPDCGVLKSRPSSRRAASFVTVMSMAGGEGEGALRQRLADEPESVQFEDTMAAIADGFDYVPKRFVNGETSSDSGVNEGSCKVFAFGKIVGLSAEDTLACFGEHYRGVLADPDGESHGNIRAFMASGWGGVDFPDGLPLSPK